MVYFYIFRSISLSFVPLVKMLIFIEYLVENVASEVDI